MMIDEYNNKQNWVSFMRDFSFEDQLKFAREYINQTGYSKFSDAFKEAHARFFALMNMRMSIIHFLELRTYSPFWYASTQWHSKERFGSEKIRFPISGIFGAKDWMSSQDGLQ